MQEASRTRPSSGCLGRTCLKWGADGDLTALDRDLVLQRLAQVDEQVAALLQPTATR
ncbi:MAG: hypothetical protein VKJ66_01580 [Synechococcus sp.]|nr:hypothetical protein [Synechococcus sp.]